MTDAASVVIGLGLAYLMRVSISPIPREWLSLVTVAPLAWVAIFYAHGLYSPQPLAKFEEFRRVISASAAGVVVIAVFSFWWHTEFSRIWIGLAWVLSALLTLGSRSMWRHHVEQLQHDDQLALRTIVVGSSSEARKLWRALESSGTGFKPISLYPPDDIHVEHDDGIDVLRYDGDLIRAICDQEAECLFVASSDVTPVMVAEIAKIARLSNVEVRVSASLPEMVSSRVSVQPVAGMMVMTLRPVQLSGVQAASKRLFDAVIGGLFFLISLPVLAAIALAIKMESRGPVLFKQARITQGGRIFEMYKFRTMVKNPVEDELDTSVPFFKLDEDPRVTRVGHILRATSLDELPQLINVIKGEMSLVGPRPLPVDQVEANLDLLEPRHEVPAGVTGWWQISGRSSVGAEEAIKMDLFYIENWSLGLDLYIMLRTLGAVVTRRGAV